MATCPPARLLAASIHIAYVLAIYVEGPCKFTACYMAKDGEELSEMLGIQLQLILTSQKSPEVMLRGDDICLQELAKRNTICMGRVAISSINHRCNVVCLPLILFVCEYSCFQFYSVIRLSS